MSRLSGEGRSFGLLQENRIREKPDLVGIQYLRGLAALAVVFDHTSATANFDKYFGHEILAGFLRTGARGVDLFFMISGFIICMISLRGRDLSPVIPIGVFAERRFTRIVPLMWLAILSYAMLRILGRGTFFAGPYLRALTLFPAWDVQPTQIWTLRHEAIFYTVFAVSFLVRPRRGLLLAGWAALPFAHSAITSSWDPGSLWSQVIRVFAHPVNIEFYIGFLTGILWHRLTKSIELRTRVSPFFLCMLYFIGVMVVVYYVHFPFHALGFVTILSILFLPLLLFSIHVKAHDGALDRFGQFLGSASYSIYLFHPHFVSAMLGLWAHYGHQTPLVVVVVVIAICATALCLLVHMYIERPLLVVSRNMMRRLMPSSA